MTDLTSIVLLVLGVSLPSVSMAWVTRRFSARSGQIARAEAAHRDLALVGRLSWEEGRTTPRVVPTRDWDEDAVDDIQQALDLEELARLSPEDRAGVDLWARQTHYDTHHDRHTRRGIYACCLMPQRPDNE